ncbi:hypothetical protein [Vibrio phage vB_VhaP_PG11]|nr:hypothetical protein [Vibrio phage vB_VhaP_PG11]
MCSDYRHPWLVKTLGAHKNCDSCLLDTSTKWEALLACLELPLSKKE